PAGIGPGRKPRVVRPGTWPFGRARYSASLEKPCGVIVTSGWLDPPQPRNSAVPHVRPAGGGCQRPRSIVWLEPSGVVPSGESQQYLTRTDVVPAGTSNGTITYEPWSECGKLPSTTWVGAIGSPPAQRPSPIGSPAGAATPPASA